MINKKVKSVYEDQFISIAIDYQGSFLQSTWLQHPNSEQFKAGFKRAFNWVQQNTFKLWLHDDRQLLYIDKICQNWIKNEILPQIKECKEFKFARVVTPATLNSFDTEDVFNSMDNHSKAFKGLQIGIFTTVYQALSWLETDNNF